MPFQTETFAQSKVIIRIIALRRSLSTERGDHLLKRCVFSGLCNQHSFWTLKVKNHDLYKEGLSELTLRRPRSSIMEVESALPVPLFRLFLSFFVLQVSNCSCYVFL